VQLVVARRKGVNRKAAMQFSTSMGTLGEEPEEVGMMGKVGGEGVVTVEGAKVRECGLEVGGGCDWGGGSVCVHV